MALRLIYLVFSKLLGWIVLRTRSDDQEEIEILVLRHHLAVLWTTHATTANDASVAQCRVLSGIRSANARGVARRADGRSRLLPLICAGPVR